MRAMFRHLALIAAFLSFIVPAHASASAEGSIPGSKNPAAGADVRAPIAADKEAARSLLNDVVRSGKDAETRCSAINTLAASADAYIVNALADVINDSDPAVQTCAIRAAGESRNGFAAETLLFIVESYLTQYGPKGHYETNLLTRIKAIDSIWSLGEIGSPAATEKLLKFFSESDNVVKVNIAISAGKTKAGYIKKFLRSLAGDTNEVLVVRAAAYEMLSESKASAPAPGALLADGLEKGDLLFAGGRVGIPQSWIGEMPVGHSGIFGGTEVRGGKLVVVIYDCVPESFKPYGGVRKIYSWKYFTHGNKYPFYGNRVSRSRPTASQRRLIIKAAIAKLGYHYSDTHISQKGPNLFDCVGYTEYAYEAAGLNPPPPSSTPPPWPTHR